MIAIVDHAVGHLFSRKNSFHSILQYTGGAADSTGNRPVHGTAVRLYKGLRQKRCTVMCLWTWLCQRLGLPVFTWYGGRGRAQQALTWYAGSEESGLFCQVGGGIRSDDPTLCRQAWTGSSWALRRSYPVS